MMPIKAQILNKIAKKINGNVYYNSTRNGSKYDRKIRTLIREGSASWTSFYDSFERHLRKNTRIYSINKIELDFIFFLFKKNLDTLEKLNSFRLNNRMYSFWSEYFFPIKKRDRENFFRSHLRPDLVSEVILCMKIFKTKHRIS